MSQPGPLSFEEAPTADGKLLTAGAGEVSARPVRDMGLFGRASRRYFRSHLGSRREGQSSTGYPQVYPQPFPAPNCQGRL